MRTFRTPALAIAILALASIATPSFAGSPYYDGMGTPMGADQAEMTYNNMMHPEMMMGAEPRMRGHHVSSPMKRQMRMHGNASGDMKSGM